MSYAAQIQSVRVAQGHSLKAVRPRDGNPKVPGVEDVGAPPGPAVETGARDAAEACALAVVEIGSRGAVEARAHSVIEARREEPSEEEPFGEGAFGEPFEEGAFEEPLEGPSEAAHCCQAEQDVPFEPPVLIAGRGASRM